MFCFNFMLVVCPLHAPTGNPAISKLLHNTCCNCSLLQQAGTGHSLQALHLLLLARDASIWCAGRVQVPRRPTAPLLRRSSNRMVSWLLGTAHQLVGPTAVSVLEVSDPEDCHRTCQGSNCAPATCHAVPAVLRARGGQSQRSLAAAVIWLPLVVLPRTPEL